MKKSHSVKLLVLATLVASACESKKSDDWNESNSSKSKMYLRADSSRPYTRSFLPAYFAFRAFGMLNNGVYTRTGYQSSAISSKSNAPSIRGGLGKSGMRVSS